MVQALTSINTLPPVFPEIVDFNFKLSSVVSAPELFLNYLKRQRQGSIQVKEDIISLINRTIVAVEDTELSAARPILQKIVCIAMAILRCDFEQKAMSAYDALVTAACIGELERTRLTTNYFFLDKSITTTRSLLYQATQNRVAVIALPSRAKIKEKGSYKQVLSSALLELNNFRGFAACAVVAQAISSNQNSMKRVHNGISLLLQLDSRPGICVPHYAINCWPRTNREKPSYPTEIRAVFNSYQGDLTQIIHDIVFVSDLEKLIIMRDLVRGLAYLHSQNSIHGDIKPGNTLFCADGTEQGAKGALTDFDFSFNLSRGDEPTYILKAGYYGSIHFTDPQFFGRSGPLSSSVDDYKQLDSWALACTLFQFWHHYSQVPWATFIQATYAEGFDANGNPNEPALLIQNKKKVVDSIQKHIENALEKLLQKPKDSYSFSDHVNCMLFSLLRNEPSQRISLTECENRLLELIDLQKRQQAQLEEEKKAHDIAYKNGLKQLAESGPNLVSTAHKLNKLFNFVMNRDSQRVCHPIERNSMNTLLRAAKAIANENDPHPAKEFFSDIIKLFKMIQSTRFEKFPLSIQDAWQLAAFCKIEFQSGQQSVEQVSAQNSGLARDLQFDPRSSLVTLMANRQDALRNIQNGAFKLYKSAFTFSLASLDTPGKNTLYMRNKYTTPHTYDLQVVAKEMELYGKIKSRLPRDIEMPILFPLTQWRGSLGNYEVTNNYDCVTAVYEEYQGSLEDIALDTFTATFEQKLSLAKQLLQKLLELHKIGVALGDVKLANALFRLQDDEKMEAIWTDIGSAYCVDDPIPDTYHLVERGIYGCIYTTEPQFFGCENAKLTPKEHLALDAWAFGIMLHELFIGEVAWKNEMLNGFQFMEDHTNSHPNTSHEQETPFKNLRTEIDQKLQTSIEEPFLEMQKKTNPTQKERLKILIWGLLRHQRQMRLSLDAVYRELVTMTTTDVHT